MHPPDMSLEEAVRRQWTVMFSPKFLETQQDFLEMLTQRALLHPAPPHTGLRHFMALQRFNTYGRLGTITVPTLVVTGADDVIVPPTNSFLLATRIHGASLEILAHTGHGFFWEAPWDVVALLHKFCYAL
jgi:pimeloyl-ACP methyl ester carboxylesterase